MTAVTAVTLAAYLVVAVRIFTSDKMAEVAYSSAAVAQALATQGRIELESLLSTVKPVMTGFDLQTNDFAPSALALLRQDSRFVSMSVYRPNGNTYQKIKDVQNLNQNIIVNLHPTQIAQIAQTGVWVGTQLDGGTQRVVIGARFGQVASPQHTVVLVVVDKMRFVDSIKSRSNYALALVGENGRSLFYNEKLQDYDGINFANWPLIQQIQRSKSPPGTAEVTDVTDDTLLTSYANVGYGTLTVVAFIGKKEAMRAVQILITKSVIMFIALLLTTFLIASLSSKKITSALSLLTRASKEVATGKFDVHINVGTQDEIGSLAESFNTMAKQLSYYVVQVAEKAMLESELNTARTVQETLFPPNQSQLGEIEISGHYEPASQCGGDWWHYSSVGDKVFMWIGDATGHGVPAALLTSAARSAASIIELFPDVTPAQALLMMNRAIHDTSHGKLLMTFFIACYDRKAHTLSYANASHEAPWLVKKTDGEIKKKHLIPLNEVAGPRLGEKLDARYKEGKVELEPGDRIFFYTDGLSDLKNTKGESWGERVFMKSILNALNAGPTAQNCTYHVINEINQYRSTAKLEDDVTYFFVKVGDAA